MKEIKLIIEGIEYRAQVAEEDIKDIINNKTGYERVRRETDYYFDNGWGNIDKNTSHGDATDDDRYNLANYYSSREIAKNNVRADTLMRRLRQWQALNDKPIDWSDENTQGFYIVYNYSDNTLEIDARFVTKGVGMTYFTSREKAEEAIKLFKSELTWYFTEYQQRLDEPKHN